MNLLLSSCSFRNFVSYKVSRHNNFNAIKTSLDTHIKLYFLIDVIGKIKTKRNNQLMGEEEIFTVKIDLVQLKMLNDLQYVSAEQSTNYPMPFGLLNENYTLVKIYSLKKSL